MDAAYIIAAAAAAVWRISLWFSVVWAILYVTVGSWAKVRYRNPKGRADKAMEKRYLPVVVSHVLFSVVFANPFCVFLLSWHLGWFMDDAIQLQFEIISGISDSLGAAFKSIDSYTGATLYWMLSGAYFLLLPLLVDCLVMRVPRHRRWLRRLIYRADWSRWVWVHLVITAVLLVLAFTMAWGIAGAVDAATTSAGKV